MKNEITVQQTTTVYEYELIDNGVLLTDTECGLRVAALNDDDGRASPTRRWQNCSAIGCTAKSKTL